MKRHYVTTGIAVVLAITAFITGIIDGRFAEGIGDIVFILLLMLVFAAFRRPTIPFASAFAGFGTLFADIYIAIKITEWIVQALGPSVISPDSSVGFMLGAFFCGLFYGIYDSFHCVVKIQKMQTEDFDSRYQSAAANRDIDEMIRFMAKYLRPEHSDFMLIIAGLLVMGIAIFAASLSGRRGGTEETLLYFAGVAACVCITAGMLIRSRRSYRSYISQLSDSGEGARMAEDFFRGTRYWDNEIVLGEQYIFVRNGRVVHKYSDIAKIYQRWSDVNTMHRSPWWHLRIVTTDGKDWLLAPVPYKRTDENFNEFVLPVILEIRSRNPQVVIG